MFKNIYKKFFFLIFFIILFIIILLTFNTNFRKLTLFSALNFYKAYMTVSMQLYLKTPDPDYVLINDKLKNFIKVSKKISSGKSKLLIGIYDAANLVQSSIIDDEKFGDLEEFFSDLVDLDPNLYEAKIWYAKSLYANNKIEASIKEIDKAIKLSPIDPGPYRLAFKIFLQKNDYKKFNYYCEKYLKSEFGGKKKRYQSTKFDGFNFNDFSIKFKSENILDKNNYIIRGINQGKFDQYELVPQNSINISSIEMTFSFNPGTVLEIDEIQFFSKDKVFNISEKDLLINSKNSFFNNNGTQKQIIFSSQNNEVLDIKLKQPVSNIDKIIFLMKFEKLSLVNKSCK